MAWQFYGFMHPEFNRHVHGSRSKDVCGPLPCKRWIKSPADKRHKVSRKASGPRPFPPNAESQAAAYAVWLAARDGIALPESRPARCFWTNIINRAGKVEKRIHTVRFGSTAIELPNWDWTPLMTEEHETELQLAA